MAAPEKLPVRGDIRPVHAYTHGEIHLQFVPFSLALGS